MFKKQKEIDALRLDIGSLKRANDANKKEARIWQVEHFWLEIEFNKMKLEHNTLKAEHKQLLTTAGDLGAKTQALIEEYYELKKEHSELIQVNNELNNKLYEMECDLSWYNARENLAKTTYVQSPERRYH